MIEGMFNIRPDLVQELLMQCKSVRVKRLFLYMAKKAKLPVLEFLDLAKVDLGIGIQPNFPPGLTLYFSNIDHNKSSPLRNSFMRHLKSRLAQRLF